MAQAMGEAERTQVLVVTASVVGEMKKRYRAEGMGGYLSKPF